LHGKSRKAGGYVGRIRNGEKLRSFLCNYKCKVAINLKTAKTLGLTIPSAVFARVDEVIE
jgi:putative ABC transport system substrate-binding protein